jgi:hypothetical protein
MRVFKFLCTPASAHDDYVLREQVRHGAIYRRQIALIENRERFLRRGIADYPAKDVPMDQRSAWWKSEVGKAASAAWRASDEYKALNAQISAAKKLALKAVRDATIEAGAMWGTLGKADDAAEFARRAVDKIGLIDKNGQTTTVSTHFPLDEGRIAVQFQKGSERIDPKTGRKIPAKKLIYADALVGSSDTRLRIGSVAYALGTPVKVEPPADVDDAVRRHMQPSYRMGWRPAALDASGAAIDVTKVGPRSGVVSHKGKRFHALAIRVGTVPGTIRPIWANMHVLLHQNPRSKNQLVLGHDVVKWAVIRRERTGLRYKWFLTLETEGDVMIKTPHPHPNDSIAVHIGWRQLFDDTGACAGIRVLSWSATAPIDPNDPTSPHEGQLVIPEIVLRQKPFADQMRSTRDKNQDVLRDMILVYARSLPEKSWLRVEARHMHQWRSPSKFVRLYNHWEEQRIHGDQAAFAKSQDVLRDMILVYTRSLPTTSWLHIETQNAHISPASLYNQWKERRIHGDQAAFAVLEVWNSGGSVDEAALAALEAWMKQDRHLLHREAPSLERMHRQIEGRVTALAVQIAKRYGVVTRDDFALPDLVEKDEQHDEDEQKLRKKNARRVNVVGPGRARAIVGYFAKKYGCVDQKVDSAGGTLDCDACGHRREIAREDRAQRVIRCENCGHVEDQDFTMSRNLLRAASAIARGESGWPLEPKVLAPSTKKRASVRRNRRRGQQTPASDVVTP